MCSSDLGLQINVQNNGVNPSTQIILRGLRSISGNNSALIVIDGSIASEGAFNDLNPNDIASINVLKGATAAALYGSEASNGAILVTTKKGSGKFKVGINSSYTVESVAYMPRFQSEHGTGWEGVYDPRENTNWGPRYDGQIRRVGPVFPAGYGLATQMIPYAPVKNNLLDFYQKGGTANNTIYFSGGNKKDGSIYVSFGDQRTKGIVPKDTYQRNSVRMNASQKFGKVTLTTTTNYFTDKTDIVGTTIGAQNRNLYWFILNTSTNIPLSSYKDWQNPLSYGYADNYQNSYYQNPYWAIGTNRNIDYTNRFIGNFNVSWDILDWLNFTVRVGTNNVWGHGKNWRASQTYSPVLKPQMTAVSSFVEETEFKSTTYTGDALLSAHFNLGKLFTLKPIIGYSVNTSYYRSSYIRANDLSIPNFYDISNGTGSLIGTTYQRQKRVYGFYADVTLGFKNYLFLDLAGRNDWTSTLAKGNNSYFYPSIGLSFVFTDAFPVLKNSVLSYGKFTISNAIVYNDLAPYQINESYSQAAGFPYGSLNGFYLSNTAVDANITKEKINTTEIGLNLGFFEGRLRFDGSYFNTTTSNLITNTTPSTASGATGFLTNIGELRGDGVELTLGGTAIKTHSFRWDISANFTHFVTIVKSIKPGLDEVAVATNGQVGVYAVVGQAFPQMKANVYKRDPQGQIIIDPTSGYPLTEKALANLGQTTPKYIIGFTSSATFKGLTLSITTDYRTGHVFYEQGSDMMEFTGRSLESVSANRQDFVIPNSVIETSPGVYVKNTNIPVRGGLQDYWTDVYNNVKSNYVKDATAFKVRELSLTYSLPSKLLRNTVLSKVSIAIVARNIFTRLPSENRFSDPEFNNSYTNGNAIGIGGYLQSPPTKTYGFNLNVQF